MYTFLKIFVVGKMGNSKSRFTVNRDFAANFLWLKIDFL